MPPTPPTDAELDTMIRARLASQGIDIDQLPAGSTPDPVTGSPGRDSVLASLRAFLRTTVAEISAFQMPVPAGSGSADAAAMSQQSHPPLLYPSIATEWTKA